MLIIQKNGKNLKLDNYRLCYDFTLFPFSSKIKMSFRSKPMELPISTLLGIFAKIPSNVEIGSSMGFDLNDIFIFDENGKRVKS